jgi:hypothetical protein
VTTRDLREMFALSADLTPGGSSGIAAAPGFSPRFIDD